MDDNKSFVIVMVTALLVLLILIGGNMLIGFYSNPHPNLWPVIGLLETCDFPGSSQFYGLQEDDPQVAALLDLCQR